MVDDAIAAVVEFAVHRMGRPRGKVLRWLYYVGWVAIGIAGVVGLAWAVVSLVGNRQWECFLAAGLAALPLLLVIAVHRRRRKREEMARGQCGSRRPVSHG